jgi:hypothetical protein
MTRLTGVFTLTLAFAGAVDAHTLDEYVQALRVGVRSARLLVFLDLTPGINIAAHVLQRIDGDGDDALSPTEAEAYARSVIADLAITLDGDDVALSLVRVETPAAEELRDGQGTIRIEASTSASIPSGRHRLVVRNGHLPDSSVYLANALLPDAADIRILQQARDFRQQTYSLDYEIRGANTAALAWLLAASTILTMLVCARGLKITRKGLSADCADYADLDTHRSGVIPRSHPDWCASLIRVIGVIRG